MRGSCPYLGDGTGFFLGLGLWLDSQLLAFWVVWAKGQRKVDGRMWCLCRRSSLDFIGYVDGVVIVLRDFLAHGTVVCLRTFSFGLFLYLFVMSSATSSRWLLSRWLSGVSDILTVSKHSVCKEIRFDLIRYRSISFLSCIDMILECIVTAALTFHPGSHGLLYFRQFWFHRSHITEEALFIFVSVARSTIQW